MKPSILESEVKKEIVERIAKLNADSTAQWGKMTVCQMLLHLYKGLQIAYGEITPTTHHTTRADAMLIRFLVMNTDFDSPEDEVETYPELDLVAQGIYPTNFDELQKQLIHAVKKFPEKHTLKEHPVMGEYSDWSWGRLNYVHISHHLKQFGV